MSENNDLPASPPNLSSEEEPEARILLSMGNERNERILRDWLTDQAGITPVPDGPEELSNDGVDLCIVDGQAFRRFQESLVEYKETGQPPLVPYLLLQGAGQDGLDADVRRCVDEVITVPIDKAELAWRIRSLLQLRILSVELLEEKERLEHLAGAVAHNLRNPLMVAKSYLEELDDGDALARIRDAHDRMEALIDEVLALDRAKSGMVLGERDPIPIRALVEECWIEAPTEDATLDLDIDEKTTVMGDALLLRQIFEALVRNAIEHAGSDGNVAVGLLPDRGGFYVADDGPGIPAEDAEHVFDPGVSTSGGFGLGLVIVRRVAETHGWTVDVTESEWGGARFEFSGVEISG